MPSSTYSFLNITASLTGPGGSIILGTGSGSAEEGITVEMAEDKDTLTIGADGFVMHSLHASQAGRIMIRLLKTSPTNALLSALYAFQTASSATHGQNVITVNDTARGDNITGSAMAFQKFPTLGYAKDGAMNEWTFSGIVIQTLGSGVLLAA